MRMTTIGRYAALLLLLAGILAGPAVPISAGAGFAVVVAQEDDEDDDREEEREEREEEAEERREEQGEKREERAEDAEERREEREEEANPVEPAAGYDVEVTCTVAGEGASTECVVTGVAPGGERISSILLPADAVCSRVIGGERRYVDPDPQANVTGYRSQVEDRPLTLVLEGRVTTGGAATYWIGAANEIYPAIGPGFFCDEPAAGATRDTPPADLETFPEATLEATPEATPAAAPGTGTVSIVTYACAGVPDDTSTSAYDWYGACDAGGDHRFVLAPIDDGTTDLLAADTAKTGEATFAAVPPGRYDLDGVDAAWCHAESDGVDAEGQVMVEADRETTVWLFYCQEGSGS